VTFHGACMKMCEDTSPNFSDKRTGCCIKTMHRLTLPLKKLCGLSPRANYTDLATTACWRS
jgi:hypothetical protein